MEFRNLIDNYKEDIIKKTQELIRIKSVEEAPLEGMPFGEGPYNALKYTVNLADELGFKTEEFDGYAAHADLGEGDETVGMLVHLDVVPEGDGWTYNPYGGEIHDGKIYGRGTTDDKGPAIAALYAMKALKDSKTPMKRKVRIIFGTNEETGWGCMKHYFSKVEAPTMAFVPDADFPVINREKGIIVFNLEYKLGETIKDVQLIDIKGGSAPNMVPDTAIATFEVQNVEEFISKFNSYKEEKTNLLNTEVDGNIVKIIAKGVSAHGSTPEKGENAISYLMECLAEILEANDSFAEFVKIYNERIGFYHNGEKIGCGIEDEESGKLNFNPGMIRLEDNSIYLTINVRYPITSSAKEVYNGIRENLKGTELELVEGDSDQKPLYVPEDNFLVKKLMDVYRSETGDNDSEPIAIGGGTYARAMENAVAFGPMFPGQKEVAHQKDEYISIDHLMKITEIYTKALYELTK
ncbi:MAG: dipeptidase PepV [Tissierellaceae bacterium]|nr:dipeptidase PepV [Tissierellaceae bacterium]